MRCFRQACRPFRSFSDKRFNIAKKLSAKQGTAQISLWECAARRLCYNATMAEKPNASEPTKPRRRWFQFSLRTLLIVVVLIGCGMGWLGPKVYNARRQRAVVAAIRQLGGKVAYDYEFNAQGEPAPNLESPRKAWLHALVGDDFVGSVYEVSFDDPANHPLSDADLKLVGELTQLRTVGLSGIPITGAGLEHLKGLTQLKQLDIDGTEVTDAGLQQLQGLTQLEVLSLSFTKITDGGLQYLHGLTKLSDLYLGDTQVTDAGVATLQKALPNCHISR